MQNTEQMTREPLGPQGEPCAECGAPLAADQRYCINCGRRRGEPRTSPASAPVASPADEAPAGERSSARPNDVSPLGAVLGVALLGGMLLIGVLIGRSDSSSDPPPSPIVQVGGATTTGQTTTSAAGSQASAAGVASEWPDATNGFTVQISTLPKAGTTSQAVEAARKDAESRGAKAVGVLDSDLYPSLAPGNYVIYSGVFSARGDATTSLKDVSSSFPEAQVVEVNATASGESEVAPGASAGGAQLPPTQGAGQPSGAAGQTGGE